MCCWHFPGLPCGLSELKTQVVGREHMAPSFHALSLMSHISLKGLECEDGA